MLLSARSVDGVTLFINVTLIIREMYLLTHPTNICPAPILQPAPARPRGVEHWRKRCPALVGLRLSGAGKNSQ